MDRQRELQRAWQQTVEARSIQVPTADRDVRLQLRECGEPQTLFGEGPYERRERLRAVLLQIQKQAPLKPPAAADQNASRGGDKTFYTEGSSELKHARLLLAHYSLPLILGHRRPQDEEDLPGAVSSSPPGGGTAYQCVSSTVVDTRPLLTGAWNCDGSAYITGGMSGVVKFWSVNDAEVKLVSSFEDTYRHHSVKAHPCDPGVFAAGNADGAIKIYRVNKMTEEASCVGGENAALSGHELTVNELEWHGACGGGRWLFSSSNDETWRWWDLEKGCELMYQEGHVAGVYGLKLSGDGNLMASGDGVGVIRLWDLRVGKSIAVMREHIRQVLSLAWRTETELVSVSGDRTMKIWDLRRMENGSGGARTTIAAHTHVINHVEATPEGGLITASHDRTAKLWSSRNQECEKTLIGHESFIYSAGRCPRSAGTVPPSIATVSYDRTLKFWQLATPGRVH